MLLEVTIIFSRIVLVYRRMDMLYSRVIFPFFLLITIFVVIIPFFIIVVYLQIYKRHVNNVLNNSEYHGRMVSPHKVVIVSTVIVLFIGIIVSLFVGYKIAQNYYEGSIDQFAATDLETYYAEVKEISENTIIVEGISINEKKYQGEFRYEIGGEVSIVKDDKIISISELEQGDLISVILIAGEGHVKGITDVFKITVIEELDK